MSELEEPTAEMLARWHREWQAVGLSRMAELIAVRSTSRLIRTPGVQGVHDLRLREAERWFVAAIKEAEADRRREHWLTRFNTVGVILGIALAILALWRGW